MTEDAAAHHAYDQERRHEEHSETLGRFMKRHRTSQGKSLEEIAKVTRIHASTLQAIEEDNPRALPAEVFTKGFIRIYAQHLGLDPDHAINWYVQQLEEEGGPRTPGVIAGMQELNNPEQSAQQGRGGKLLVVLLIIGLLLGYWYWTGRAVKQEMETDDVPPAAESAKPDFSQPIPEPQPVNEQGTLVLPPQETSAVPSPAGPEQEAGQTVPPTPPTASPTEPSPPAATGVTSPAATAPATPPVPTPGTAPVQPAPEAAQQPAPAPVAQPAGTPVSVVPQQPGAPTASVAPKEQQAASETAPSPPPKIEPIVLSARFAAKTLVRVRVDGKGVQEASYKPGEQPVWKANRKIVITIPNPESTTLFLDDKPYPLAGKIKKNLQLTFPEPAE
ncbi:MAG: RodZ domain-containing protein [Thermodesulfobacteriota bacterium]